MTKPQPRSSAQSISQHLLSGSIDDTAYYSEVVFQQADIAISARDPPFVVTNVAIAGTHLHGNGDAHALAGVQNQWASLNFFDEFIATIKGFDLSRVRPPEGRTFEGTVYRYENPDRLDTTFTAHPGNVAANHRYSGPGEGAVYGGTSSRTALREVEHYGAADGRVVAQQDIRLNNVLDLTDPSVRSRVGVSLDDISGDSYQYTQQIGTWARQQGYDGILAPSARNVGGSNIVVL